MKAVLCIGVAVALTAKNGLAQSLRTRNRPLEVVVALSSHFYLAAESKRTFGRAQPGQSWLRGSIHCSGGY